MIKSLISTLIRDITCTHVMSLLCVPLKYTLNGNK